MPDMGNKLCFRAVCVFLSFFGTKKLFNAFVFLILFVFAVSFAGSRFL